MLKETPVTNPHTGRPFSEDDLERLREFTNDEEGSVLQKTRHDLPHKKI